MNPSPTPTTKKVSRVISSSVLGEVAPFRAPIELYETVRAVLERSSPKRPSAIVPNRVRAGSNVPPLNGTGRVSNAGLRGKTALMSVSSALSQPVEE